jgi:uncharacterized protein (DUF1800 family)
MTMPTDRPDEGLRAQIERILSPAINPKAPYAVQMIDALVALLAQASAEPSEPQSVAPAMNLDGTPLFPPGLLKPVTLNGNANYTTAAAACSGYDDLLAAANRDARDLDPDLAPVVTAILHAVGGYGQGFKVQAILRAWIAGRAAAPSEDAK